MFCFYVATANVSSQYLRSCHPISYSLSLIQPEPHDVCPKCIPKGMSMQSTLKILSDAMCGQFHSEPLDSHSG